MTARERTDERCSLHAWRLHDDSSTLAARVPADATAYALRSSKIMVNLFSIYGQPEEAAAHGAWIDRFAVALEQCDTGAYVNFLGTDVAARIRAAYPGPTYDRLAAIKARYDPTNLFRLNQNIPPSE